MSIDQVSILGKHLQNLRREKKKCKQHTLQKVTDKQKKFRTRTQAGTLNHWPAAAWASSWGARSPCCRASSAWRVPGGWSSCTWGRCSSLWPPPRPAWCPRTGRGTSRCSGRSRCRTWKWLIQVYAKWQTSINNKVMLCAIHLCF